MKVLRLFSLLLVVRLVSALVNEGESVALDLKTGESKSLVFASKSQNLILYVMEFDSSSDSIGQIDASYLQQVVDLDGKYQSAFFRSESAGEKEVQFKCVQGPCQCRVAGYSSEEGQLLSQEETKLVLSKKNPVALFLVNLPKKTSYDHLIYSIRTDDEALDMDHVGLDIFGQMSVKSHIEKTRLFFFVDSSDEETCEECSIEVVVSANFKSSSKAAIWVIVMQLIPYTKLLPRVFGRVDEKITSPEQAEFDSYLEGEFLSGEIGLVFHNEDLIGSTLNLAVSGIEGLYSIEMISSSNDPLLYLDGVFASQLQVDSVHNYLFKAAPLEEDDSKYVQIVLQTIGTDNNPLELFILPCSNKECKSENFNEYKCMPIFQFKDDQESSSPLVSFAAERYSQKLSLEPKCSSPIEGFCWYKLAVKGSAATENMHYVLYASSKEGFMKVKANRPFTSTILEGDVQGLVYYYEPSKHDVSLTFTISSPHAVFYISNRLNCKTVTSECAQWEGSVHNSATVRDLAAGAYFISVQGLLTTEYTFSVELLNRKDTSVIILQEGQKIRSELLPGKKGQDVKYFQFEVELDSSKPDIQLNVQGPKYKLAVVLNKGEELPSTDAFDKISLHNFLVIQSTEKKLYQQSGMYSVCVEYIKHDDTEDFEDHPISFSIIFTTSDSLKSLTLNEVFFDEIMPGNTNTYSLLLNSDIYGRGVLLSKQRLQPANPKRDLKVYLNSMPDREEAGFELALKGDKTSTYEIGAENIKKLCENPEDAEELVLNKDEAFVCEIFVFIENPSKERISYSLTLWKAGYPIDLHEGHALTFNLESIEKGQHMQFFYQPMSYTYDVQLFIHSYFGAISYDLKVYSTEDGNLKDSLLAFEGMAHNSHSKQISTSAFEKCRPKCVLRIEVTAPNSLELLTDGSPREVEVDDTFSILVSQKFMEIHSGQPIEVTVKKKPHYFLFNELKSLLQDKDASLAISVHEQMGKGVLCLSVSDDSNIRMPFIEDTDTCDFAIYEDEVKLTRSDFTKLMKENELNEEDNPLLIIEISNLKPGDQGRFTLLLNKQGAAQLLLAVPLQVDMDQKESRSLSFFNYVSEDIEFKIVRLAGYGWLSLSRCVSEASRQCTNETIISRKFLAGQSSSFLQVPRKSKYFCVLCNYYVDLETEEKITLTALVTVTTQSEFIKLPQGIQFTDYLEQEDVNRYRVTIDPTKQIEVQVRVFQGQPETQLFLKANGTRYGPYFSPNHYEAIIPPLEFLNESHSSSLASHLQERELYIQVDNKEGNSNYTITIMQQNGHILQDGLVTQIQLSKMQQNTTLYYYHLYGLYEPLLLVKCRDKDLADNDGTYLVKVTARVASSYQKNGFKDIELKLLSGLSNELHYQLPTQDGFYEIIVESLIRSAESEPQYVFDRNGKPIRKDIAYDFGSNYVDRLTLDVVVNSKDVFLLEGGGSPMRGYVYPGQANFYELSLTGNSKRVAIQVQDCQGTLKVGYTQNYHKFLDEEYKQTSSVQGGLTVESLVRIKPGALYLAVHNSGNGVGSYRLIATETESETAPHGKLVAGGDGIIDWELEPTDPDRVTVRFKPLVCPECEAELLEDSLVAYEIVWASEELILNELGKCENYLYKDVRRSNAGIFGLMSNLTLKLKELEEMKQLINVEFQSDHSVLYISVVAKVKKFAGEDLSNFRIFYHNSKISLPKNVVYMFKHKRTEFALAIGILLSFSILMCALFSSLINLNRCCCLGYFFSRLRKLRKDQLEVDLQKKMQDAKQKQETKDKQAKQLKKEAASQSDIKSGYGKLEEEKDVEQHTQQN